jgi:DNA-binding transcriptional LysR family regulator
VFLRQFEYLIALARERHFGRAAEACHVSQPSLSAAIRKLERELGLPLVHRHQRYNDLTTEGHTLLPWVQQTVATVEALRTEATRLRQQLSGTLRIGVIPTALPAISLVTGALLDQHPQTRVEVRSLSSIEIGRMLASHDLDAGITYLDNEPLGAVTATPIYHERYIFLTSNTEPAGDTIEWRELADVPLCLLTPDMQNRRIVNAALTAAGISAAPRVEANSITALLAFARAGRPCVMAHTWLALHGLPPGMRALALTKPEITHTIGLVTQDANLQAPIVRALRAELANLDVETQLASLTTTARRHAQPAAASW